VQTPASAPIGVVVDSPHSGMQWPDDFRPSASREAILTTWDAFVDELWAGSVGSGATLIAATFPRAYLDVNRAADDLDADLLDAPWPGSLRPTDYTRRGMGLVRRHALPGVPMYDRRLSVADVAGRLERYYHPYRSALSAALDRLQPAFGTTVHINAHSMKSRGNAMNVDDGAMRPDIVVSDRHGTTAAPALTTWCADWFRSQGLTTQINTPYQGGDLVASFGDPARSRHSIQIEVNRAVYLDESRVTKSDGFLVMRETFTRFVTTLGQHLAGGRHS
jgi:N-formylglutamate deformylase